MNQCVERCEAWVGLQQPAQTSVVSKVLATLCAQLQESFRHGFGHATMNQAVERYFVKPAGFEWYDQGKSDPVS